MKYDYIYFFGVEWIHEWNVNLQLFCIVNTGKHHYTKDSLIEHLEIISESSTQNWSTKQEK